MSERSGTEKRRRQTLVGVRLSEQEVEWLDEVTSRWHTTRPEALRQALEVLWLETVTGRRTPTEASA